MVFDNKQNASREVIELAARFLMGKRLNGKVSLVGADRAILSYSLSRPYAVFNIVI